MRKESAMCKTKMQTDELLDMIFSINQKQLKSRGNLRVEVLLKTTHELLDKELKEKQQSRKRKWEELKTGFTKKAKIDNDVEMVDEEILDLYKFYFICDKSLGRYRAVSYGRQSIEIAFDPDASRSTLGNL
ncbi:hypothetical protein HNY73_006911 [Argiope bruennichi]|uniref:Uncharacterized protein n=1 Tax=Argiope bruennichi TaxID=94029 RepID=A0A8T0FHW2_ARGBR|nr:hypothetical protein HNY73_006911 [Argiope bruennichi]